MENKSVILPKWLDNLIFGILSAQYSKKNKDLVVLEWEKDEVLCYLGTYFPRSFAESYRIFSTFFLSTNVNIKTRSLSPCLTLAVEQGVN